MPIDPLKKQAVIDVVIQRDCKDAQYVQDNLNEYSDLPDVLFEFSKQFDCDPAYLDLLLAPFTDPDLTGVDIYYNKTGIALTNPQWVIKCTNCTVTVNAGGAYGEIDVTYNSTITTFLITNSTLVDTVVIGGGSVVDLLQVNAGSCINVLLVKSCDNTFISELTLVKGGSCINNIGVDETSVYGGYECVVDYT